MHFGRFPRKTVLAATLLLAFSAANASFLEQIGSPPTTTVAMTTYGVDVATRVGLKAVIPSGWQLFVHRSVELPESLSWKVEESWVSVLSNFAKSNDIAVLVDWDKKSVYFRSTSLALQEQEKRQMIAQAAATPLPSFKSEEPAPVVAAAAPSPASAPIAAAQAQAPAAAPVAAVTEIAAAPAPAATPTAAVQPAVSVTVNAVGTTEAKPPVVAGVAIVDKAEPKPTTETPSLLSRVMALDAAPAVKPVAPVAMEEAPKVAVVPKVVEATKAPEVTKAAIVEPVVALEKPVAKAVEAVAVAAVSVASQMAAAAITPAVGMAAPQPTVAAVQPAYAEQNFAVEKPAAEAFNRHAVDMVVRTAAEKHGYIVSWEAADVQFPGPVTILGADMGEDMRLVLRALGGRRSPVSIDVYRNSNVVRVRNASGTAEVAFNDVPFQGAIREKSAPTFTVRVREEAAQPPTIVAAPAPVMPPPAAVAAPAPQVAVASAPVATTAALVVAEPARMDTAVPAIKKLEESAPLVAAAPAPTPAPVGDAEIRVESKPTPVANVTLRVERGEALRGAIEALLEPGWSLKWDVNGDMEANTALEIAGESLAAVLNKVLPRLALSADIYKPSKLVVIRPADAALDK